MADSSLDRDILQYEGGLVTNSLINILEPDADSNDDTNEPTLICRSPYYDFDMLTSTLRHKKMCSAFNLLQQNVLNYKYL